MTSFAEELRKKLKGARKIVVFGIGNELRRDDAIGLYIAKELKERENDFMIVFITDTVPENFIGLIGIIKPTHVVLIDAADFSGGIGEVRIIEKEDITAKSVFFSTHSVPLDKIMDYITTEYGCKVVIIGIQPGDVSFGTGISDGMKKAIKYVVDALFHNTPITR